METIIFPGEAEAFVESLEEFPMEEIGSKSWQLHHERVEKLNQQAVASATCQTDEFVKEYLVTHEKIPVLISNLITTEVWKEKVFPHTLKKASTESSFQLYMMMYHEAPVATLLETLTFHSDVVEAADDYILDLLDYCHRKITDTLAKKERDEPLYRNKLDSTKQNDNEASADQIGDLRRQKTDLDFCLSAKAVTIVRYICEHLSSLPLAVTNRLLNHLDIPALFVSLILSTPWTASMDDGAVYKFSDNEWRRVKEGDGDAEQITKTEGQIWIGLFHLLMDGRCQEKYEITSSRKTHLLKLRSFVSKPTLLDQLPMLGEMQRYLEHLAIMDPPASQRTKDVLIEQVPEIYDNLMARGKGKWKQIATTQMEQHLVTTVEDMRQQAKRWMDTYNFDVIENLVAPPKCVVCGEQAAKRCSKCRQEWYCRRECQVQHWSKHKTVCELLKEPEKDNTTN